MGFAPHAQPFLQYEDYVRQVKRGSGLADPAIQKSVHHIGVKIQDFKTEPKDFPLLSFFLSDGWSDGRRQSLSRVLSAFCYRNPKPGFRDGMNIIAMFLLRMTEANSCV